MNGDHMHVAIVGASGLVGRTILQVLEERKFPADTLSLFASRNSAGTTVPFRGADVPVSELSETSLTRSRASIALFSAGATVSREFAPIAVRAGITVIDNSSAWRQDPNVPLVVPEVNPGAVSDHRGIIANPNCSTIQMVVALQPLHDVFRVRRIVVSTYQSVTGAGQKGKDQLAAELAGGKSSRRTFPHPIAFNCVPHVDMFLEDGSTKEEWKMVVETRKILGDDSIGVAATCVRVPVLGGHSESVNVEFERPFTMQKVRELLASAPGVVLEDEPGAGIYPMPLKAGGRDDVFVGRVRRDPTVPNGLSLWVVADNLRKGAATNAVQIAELLLKEDGHLLLQQQQLRAQPVSG